MCYVPYYTMEYVICWHIIHRVHGSEGCMGAPITVTAAIAVMIPAFLQAWPSTKEGGMVKREILCGHLYSLACWKMQDWVSHIAINNKLKELGKFSKNMRKEKS